MNYFERLATFARTIRSTMQDISDRLLSLRDGLQDNTKAIAEANETAKAKQNANPLVLTEVHFPEGIETHTSKEDARADKKHKFWVLAVQWATFLAIVGYAAIVYLQLIEMENATDVSAQAVYEARQGRLQAEKSLRATIEQSQLDQRAWVGSKAMGLTSFAADSPITGQVVVVNTGKTFALNTVLRVWLHPSPVALTDLPHPRPKEISPMVLFPNQEMSVSVTLPDIPHQSDIDMIKAKKAAFLYLYGKVAYTDVFKHRHTTDFCGVFDGKKDFLACNFHNTAD